MTKVDYDLFVIGGGSGGVRAAKVASALGKKVAVAEEFRFGGTCVIRGCVPKKLFVYASQAGAQARTSSSFGWTAAKPEFCWNTLRNAKETEITRLEGLYRTGVGFAGAEIIDDRAELIGEGRVRLVRQNRTIKARHILIATGATPARMMGMPGDELCVTSDEMFDLPDLPKSAVVVGGGYIAVEFAGILNGLGVDTTLVYRGDKVLRGFDDDVRDDLMAAMAAKGIRLRMNSTPTAVAVRDDGGRDILLSDGAVLSAGLVMLAIGRNANTARLGLEAAGVDTTPDGRVMIDELGQSTVVGVHALGDVTNREQLTPVAIHEAICWVRTIFGGEPTIPDRSDIATAVFSQPEIGCIGLTEAEARERLPAVNVFSTRFRPMKATLTGDPTRMMMKVVVDANTDRVVGVHLLGEGAAEMIQLIGVALKAGATKADFDATMAVHPTAAEELVTMYAPTRTYRTEKDVA
ncbi:glutathione-disulfide reductase [Roseobacter sp. YSTF-M11]|uniref:Glutathione-disulfide reductase n=1 Tax=Roseobacter insulae TaxID=2859783 RepID=A0A9X1FRJ7_9RHOB|nr:glutathione-disulfide reductase [Roseobacter insulae]MBW4706337.1 glutathione-disulfide reductase [Roseobacter insulae]